MARSSNKQTLDLLLKCALCNTDLIKNIQPKTLPCLHTFCSPCLTHKHRSFVQDDNIFKCPVCHTRVEQSSEDPEISNNLKLDVIIEKLLHVRQLQQSKRHCEMCTEKAVVSKQWCLDCGKFLCDSCLVHHEKYKPRDKVIDVSQGMDFEKVNDFILPTKCSDHGEKLHAFCAHCEICLCSHCLIEHHSEKNLNCVPVSIEKVAPNTKSQGRQLLEEMSSHLEKEKQQIEDMKLRNDDLNNQCSNKCSEIWEHVAETVERLKENARTLITELEAATKSEIDESEKLIQLKQDHVEEMEIIDKNFQQLLQCFDNVDIVLNFPRLKSKFENLYIKLNTNNDDPSTLPKMNMLYNFCYLKTHEISKYIPIGRCWKDSKLFSSPPSLVASLNLQQISNVPLWPFLIPPVPYLGNPKLGEFFDEKWYQVSCIFVTNENHVLVGCGAYGTLYEYDERNTLRVIHEPKRMKYCSDLCQFSSDKMCIVDGNLILLLINKNKHSMTFLKHIESDVYSICNCYGEILVCDYNCSVHLLNEDGTVRKTILKKRQPSSDHIIRSGPFRDTFLLFISNHKKNPNLFCYSLDGETCYFSLAVREVSDLCTDKYGNIYVADTGFVYALSHDASAKYPLFTVPGQLHRPHIFIKNDIFYFASDSTGTFKLEKYSLFYHDPKSS